MATISFDTLAYVKELTTVGFTTEQADVQVKALLDALNQIEAHRLDEMASTTDLREIEQKIIKVKSDLEIELAERKVESTKWIGGIIVILATILFIRFFGVIQFLLK